MEEKPTLDFEEIYAHYPRRGEGKKAGMEKLKKSIKTRAEYERFCRAVMNYVALCNMERRDRQYIKHWSTFCNNWEDYEELEAPASGVVSQLQRVMKGTL